MPKRTDIKSILIIGAGPIVIGQACEFDYSGTQACKTLKSEGYRVILVNSNPATIMTDPGMADATYVEPITPEMVEKIILKEKPDALLPTMGGQTALNCAKALAESGVLAKHGVQLIGANLEAINKAENRQLFNEAMARINLECPKHAIAHTLEEARTSLDYVGLPAVIRPSFTMGGTGGGIAYNREEFDRIAQSGLEASPTSEILIDESLVGWKEFEMEVIRDRVDNCIIVCSIENFDPMGVHTGDSITVAPALTLTDKEYQIMRDASIKVLREIGVETGGSNVQFAVNPDNGRMVVIEMNPRVSRSSALASKATGFPIAKVATKLAIGYTLDEIANDLTGITPASFEPTIDYVVTKIPRFAFEKFPAAERTLTTAMKSVGESMAMGRCFSESLQKALCSLETGLTGLNEIHHGSKEELIEKLGTPTPDRILLIADAVRYGISIDEIFEITKVDRWFLARMAEIIEVETSIKTMKDFTAHQMLQIKKLGFSDARIAELTGRKADEIRALRKQLDVRRIYKRVDTCGAEFAVNAAYMYSSFEASGYDSCEALPSNRKKVVILGGGPNRIGQGIEFDYCCVHAAMALKLESGYEVVMVNCNPETVSTDYDTSDRLYFEPLTSEHVLDILAKESENGILHGVIVQFGGQTPLKLARAIEAAGYKIIGTSAESIDLAEDRERFKQILAKLNLKQPENGTCTNAEEAITEASRIGFPVVVRPSYVLGGRAMAIIYAADTLEAYMGELIKHFGDGPVLLDRYLSGAIEVDVDALCDGTDVFVVGVMEHIEEAGIHSGDSACVLPPYSLSESTVKELEKQTAQMAKALNVIGLINIQFAIQNGEIYVLEVNPRASRTVPFVAKATAVPVAKIASRIMAGESLASFNLKPKVLKHVSVKEAVFPFARFNNVDVILGPEMKSTGEVMGIDNTFPAAFAKAQIGAGSNPPLSGTIFISVRDSDKQSIESSIKDLSELGFNIIATRGTASYLKEKGLNVKAVNKVREGRPHIVDIMKDGGVHLVLNTTDGHKSVTDSFSIRRTALINKIPYVTTVAGIRAMAMAIKEIKASGSLAVKPLQAFDI